MIESVYVGRWKKQRDKVHQVRFELHQYSVLVFFQVRPVERERDFSFLRVQFVPIHFRRRRKIDRCFATTTAVIRRRRRRRRCTLSDEISERFAKNYCQPIIVSVRLLLTGTLWRSSKGIFGLSRNSKTGGGRVDCCGVEVVSTRVGKGSSKKRKKKKTNVKK